MNVHITKTGCFFPRVMNILSGSIANQQGVLTCTSNQNNKLPQSGCSKHVFKMSSYLAATPNHYLYYTSVFYSVTIDPKKFLFFFFFGCSKHI